MGSVCNKLKGKQIPPIYRSPQIFRRIPPKPLIALCVALIFLGGITGRVQGREAPEGPQSACRTEIDFAPEGVTFEIKQLLTGLNVVANKLGKKFDDANPLLNAQLPDGSRLAALLPPIVRPNPSVTIRKFSKVRYTIEDLIKNGAMTNEVARFLQGVVEGGHNLHDIAAEIGDCVSYVVQCGRFAEGRKISGIFRLKGYNRVTQCQEHETIFNLGGKDGHTHIHPQMFGSPTQLLDPSATTPKVAFVWDESMAIE